MAKIERFEDLQSWQKARQLTNLIYDFTEQSKFAKDFHLKGQMQDAVGSIMHNIAEGFDAGTNPEFIRFLKISRRSASEANISPQMNLLPLTAWQPKPNALSTV
ncbi:MAG: four helix bundle protein [Anaerolineales bacterium]|nr:four helix bundle protein [Anaerolineales bacterium]